MKKINKNYLLQALILLSTVQIMPSSLLHLRHVARAVSAGQVVVKRDFQTQLPKMQQKFSTFKEKFLVVKTQLTKNPAWFNSLVSNIEYYRMKALIRCGRDINKKKILEFTDLHWAAVAGDERIVCLLIDADADLNVGNFCKMTPLAIAVERGHEEIVKLLIDAGADVNYKDSFGYTPLDLAAKTTPKYNENIVNTLKASGAKLS